MNDNLKLWNSVEKTNPGHTKGVKSGGRTMIAINAQQQLKNATKELLTWDALKKFCSCNVMLSTPKGFDVLDS